MKFVSLGIDPGGVAGWGVAMDAEKTVMGGIAKTMTERHAVLKKVKTYVRRRKLPLIIVVEKWTAGGWKSYKQLLGLGKNLGVWIDPIEAILGVQEKHLLRVTPGSWRRTYFGPETVNEFPKGEDLKKIACDVAGCEDDNEAEAKCMAMWVHCSIEGQEALEKVLRRQQRALRAAARAK